MARVRSPERLSWESMVQRCTNPKNPNWPKYGGRGVVICESWRTFSNFLADMGVRPDGRTLDRIDNNGNYEPGNCRWATRSEQQRNKRPPTAESIAKGAAARRGKPKAPLCLHGSMRSRCRACLNAYQQVLYQRLKVERPEVLREKWRRKEERRRAKVLA